MEVVRSYTSVLSSLTTENQDERLDQGTVVYLMIKIYKDGAFTPWLATLKPGTLIYVFMITVLLYSLFV